MDSKPDAGSAWSERTSADLSMLLVEWGRALKGLAFYAPGNLARKDVIDRAFLAWQIELERGGPVEIHIETDGFRGADIHGRIGAPHLDELGAALRGCGVHTIAFAPELSRDAFRVVLEGLASSDRDTSLTEQLREAGAVGITINGESPTPAAAAAEPAEAPDEDSWPTTSTGSAGPITNASLGSSLLGPTREFAAEPEQPIAGLPEHFAEEIEPILEDDPLEAAADATAHGLVAALREIDQTSDDDFYCAQAGEIVDEAIRLSQRGLADEAYRAMLVFSEHAGGEGGRSGTQLRRALEALGDLAQGPRLEDLIARACAPIGASGVRAAQVLLQLEGRAMPPLLDALATETDGDRAGRLSSIVLALGEAAVPALERAIHGGPGVRARRAVQLAGELQSPRLVETLLAVLAGEPAQLRKEAARALVHIGDDAALGALIEGLESPVEDLPTIAATHLGLLGDARALPPLLRALDRALSRSDQALAREVIRALGQLGAEGAVPKLVALLERRSWLRRKAHRDLKLAAVAALERMPGREAQRALHRAAGNPDPRVRARVQQILDRRSDPAEEAPRPLAAPADADA